MLLLEMYCKAKALWLTRDRGATTAEYALIVALIVAGIAIAVPFLVNAFQDSFQDTCVAVGGADADCS